MTRVGRDLHARKQQVAVLGTTTGELLEQELAHDGDAVERFYRALPPPVTIGIETTGYARGKGGAANVRMALTPPTVLMDRSPGPPAARATAGSSGPAPRGFQVDQ